MHTQTENASVEEQASSLDLRTMFDREIPGSSGASVIVFLIVGSEDRYIVGVSDREGNPLAAYCNLDRAAALEAFHHPFANSQMPTVFDSE